MDLKPCPFCGGKAKIDEWHNFDKDLFTVECACNNKCNVRPMTHFCKTEQEAIEAWNRRAE